MFCLLFALATRILHGSKIFEQFSFQSVSTKEQSCEILLKLVQWYRRRCSLKKLWTDGRRGEIFCIFE